MRAYLLITGTLFGLLTLAHIWRMVVESAAMAIDPFFGSVTVIAAALCVWAFRLLRTTARPR